MYFLSELDPDYKAKGSRDPLGFQTIWSNKGRVIIPNLSTVSSNLSDFRILCLAKFYWEKYHGGEKGFVPFFLRLEQAFAYVRWSLGDKSFNGTDKVRRLMEQEKDAVLHLSATHHQILSDQRVYGIYGKYISPSRSMKLFDKKNFGDAMENSLKELKVFGDIKAFCDGIAGCDQEKRLDELEFLKIFYRKLPEVERMFYREHILKTEGGSLQDVLFRLLEKHPEIVEDTRREFHLHLLTGRLRETVECTKGLAEVLEQISQMDQVLYSLNSLFKLILWKNRRRMEKLLEEPVWDSLPDFHFSFSPGTEIAKLGELCRKSPGEIVKGLIDRNEEVSRKKGSAPWVSLDEEEICVAYDEYGKRVEELKPMENYEFTYFLSNYIGLFGQIMYGTKDITATAQG